MLAEKLELPENDVRKVVARAEASEGSITVGDYDNRRTTSQKYILATFFSHFGIQTAYEVMNNKLKIYTKLEGKFRKIYEKLVNIILLYGVNADIINIAHSSDILTNEELTILDDAYFKNEDLDYLTDTFELEEFLKDQIQNLK